MNELAPLRRPYSVFPVRLDLNSRHCAFQQRNAQLGQLLLPLFHERTSLIAETAGILDYELRASQERVWHFAKNARARAWLLSHRIIKRRATEGFYFFSWRSNCAARSRNSIAIRISLARALLP